MDTLDRLYDELEESGGRRGQGLAARTVLHVHRMLHKAFKDAVRRGIMMTNPAASVDPPRAGRTALNIWAVEDLRSFLDAVAEHKIAAAWLLFATTGMRRGEVAGLAREDLDLEAGHLRIQWTLGMVNGKPTWKRRPKTKAGERAIALDPATVEAIRASRRAVTTPFADRVALACPADRLAGRVARRSGVHVAGRDRHQPGPLHRVVRRDV